MSLSRRGFLAAGTAVGVGAVLPSAQAAPRWQTKVFSHVPSPGHPAYVHVHTNGRAYAGNYKAGTTQRSRVFEWRADGTLMRSWTVPGQRLGDTAGVQVAHQTTSGRLVLLETSTRSLMTLDPRTGVFRLVARFPVGAVPNYATWTPQGLVVTDFAQPVLWLVTPRGRVSAWYRSEALRGTGEFGTTGIAYRPVQRDLLITQQTASGGPTGHLYRLTTSGARPGRLSTLWTSGPGDLPDGFGIARSGRVYVANAGPTNQLVCLSPAGAELARFPALPLTGDNGSPVPFDTPCSATFLGTRVLVANQAVVSGDPGHMALLSVEVGERGVAPHLPRTAEFA